MFIELVTFACGLFVMPMLLIAGWRGIIIELGAIFPVDGWPIMELVFEPIIDLALVPFIEFPAMAFMGDLAPLMALDVIVVAGIELVDIIVPRIMFPI